MDTEGFSYAEEYHRLDVQVKELRQRIQCMHSEFAQLMTQTVETFKKQLLHPYIGDLGLQDDTTAQAHEGGAHCQD